MEGIDSMFIPIKDLCIHAWFRAVQNLADGILNVIYLLLASEVHGNFYHEDED